MKKEKWRTEFQHQTNPIMRGTQIQMKKKVLNEKELIILIQLLYKWNIRQINIKAPYLNANLDEKIYVQISIRDKNFNCVKSKSLQKALWIQTSWKTVVL